MLLPSGNDAAYAIAQNYPGGNDAFIAKLNEKAKQMGLVDTQFADAAGLLDDENFSTVKDLARITTAALKNPFFTQVVSTKRKVIRNTAGKEYVLANLNRLLGQQGVTGVKTGTTEGAGEVLVTSKVENGKTFIIIVMKSEDRFADTQTLLSLISNNVTYIDPIYMLLRSEKSATSKTTDFQ
jgi:D-alanyl-D-alanine carboxypeptidase (penicillin-binding protein 5/6)